jgi:PAS domain S-box-containing protein
MRRWWVLAVAGAASVVLLGLIPLALWTQNRDAAEASWSGRLEALATARADGVARWLRDFRQMAAMLADFPTVAVLLGDDVRGDPPFPADKGPVEHLDEVLAPLTSDPEVVAVGITTAAGDVRLTLPVREGPVGRFRDVFAEGETAITGGSAEGIEVALRAEVRSEGFTLGWLVLLLDGALWLDDHALRAGCFGETCDVYLVRSTADGMQSLSKPRFAGFESLPAPIGSPALERLGGHEGAALAAGSSEDYRGTRVLSAASPVAGADWWVVAEADHSEVLRSARIETVVESLSIVLPVVLVGVAIGVGWQRRRRQLVRQADRSEAMYRRIVETANEGVLTTDSEGRLTYVNHKLCEMLGMPSEELIGQRFDAQLKGPAAQIARERFRRRSRGEMESYELEGTRPDGSALAVWVHSTPLSDDDGAFAGSLAMLSDITELKTTQAQLVHSQKLEAVGRLAASVAHDFNNILQIVLGSVQLLTMRLKGRAQEERILKRLSEQVDRGTRITRQLLVFARRQPTQQSRFDLREPVEASMRLLRALLREDVKVELRVPEEAVMVAADPVHVEQIVMNLAINAADAMPLGGQLTIVVSADGGVATVRVIDTGSGVPAEIRDELFEPFFTTKEATRGTGLGLSIVRQLALQHGGDVKLVRSEPAKGSEFAVTLPLSEAPSDDPEGEEPTEIATGHGETILLVEDDPGTRGSLVDVLREIGYRVEAASNLTEAAARLGEIRPDLILTDVVLPDGRGDTLVDEVRRRNLRAPIILMSGYPESETLPERLNGQSVLYLSKPVTVPELSTAIAEALARTQ